ncbi:MAG: class I SAM-dependent rRNA methyltransferase [Myxococcota bacterium]
MSVARLTLRPKSAKRVRSGHPWVFSNELEPGFAELEPGSVADVFESGGAFVGRGMVSPHSLIAVRICSRLRKEDLDSPVFFEMRLRQALDYRQSVWPGRRDLRLVNAEGDFLPGLVVDRFGDHLAVQINTVGMEVRKPQLLEALQKVLGPSSGVLRNDNKVRELEGLELGREVWFGEPPESVDIDELGVTFRVPLLGGQKTGHFYDQAENRRFAGSLCAGRSVLDVYANSGGFALQALRQGATHAVTVDKSAPNAAIALENARLNGFADRFEAVTAEGNRDLEERVGRGERYGAVVLDPPAFAKSRKTAGNALRGYTRINALGMTLVEPGGFLFTSSCSHHVHEDRFLEALQSAAQMANRTLRMVRRGEQAPDHPILPGVPETRYLKSLALQVLV